VTYGGAMFNVEHLSPTDWGWIILLTSPVLILPDLVRCVRNVILSKTQNR
jgi:Ca2+-transporting ATPase